VISGLDHVQIAIPEGGEPQARAFYGEVLALAELPKPEKLAARGGLWFALPDGRQLHLGSERSFVPARKAHAALRADDADAVAARLADAGHPVRWDDEIPGVRRFHVDDPFGNRVEVVETTPMTGSRPPYFDPR
jgi:catechol 2,3-dioxygenase-like lactoylglutathione lyase family enzyme